MDMSLLRILLLFTLLKGIPGLNHFVCDEVKNTNFHVDLCTIRGINTTIPDAISFTKSHYITTVKFEESFIDRIPEEFFRNMPAVSVIVERVGLSDLDPLTFRYAIGLREFRARMNSISKIWRRNFKGAPHLQLIDLSANNIDSINQDAFEGLKLLRWLDLSQNNLKVIDNNWFRYSAEFIFISIANNMVESAILELQHAVPLVTLDLSSDKLQNPNFMFLYMNLNCKHLTNVDLSFNLNLQQISIYCAEKGIKETALFISNTNLGAINPALIIDPRVKLTKLVANDANYTRLEEISSFGSTLKYLSLQGKPLLKGIHLLNEMTELENLSLRNVGLDEINDPVFNKMFHLKQLDLADNQIEDLNWQIFENLHNLEVLDLENNLLSSINGSEVLEMIPSLSCLNVKNNLLSHEELISLFEILDENDVVLKY